MRVPVAAPSARRDAGQSAKCSAEMHCIGEPRRFCHLLKPHLCFEQKTSGPTYAGVELPAIGSHSGRRSERMREVRLRQPDKGRKSGKFHTLGNVRIEIFHNSLHLPWSEPSHLSWRTRRRHQRGNDRRGQSVSIQLRGRIFVCNHIRQEFDQRPEAIVRKSQTRCVVQIVRNGLLQPIFNRCEIHRQNRIFDEPHVGAIAPDIDAGGDEIQMPRYIRHQTRLIWPHAWLTGAPHFLEQSREPGL